MILTVLGGGWWWASTPRLGDGGTSGVWSADHDIIVVAGPDTRMYVVPADTTGETILLFDLHNRGRLPLRIIDVWPDPPDGTCQWSPRIRELRDEPATMSTFDGPAEPAVGATIPAGGTASIWITGAHPDPGGCEHAGITSTSTVDVVVSVAGRTSTVILPLGYTFGYSDEPSEQTDSYGVSVQPRTEDLQEN